MGVCLHRESCCYLNLFIYYQVKIVFHLLARHIRCLSVLLFSKICAARRNTVRSCQHMHAKNSSLPQTRPCKNLNSKTKAHCCVEATEIVLKTHKVKGNLHRSDDVHALQPFKVFKVEARKHFVMNLFKKKK